MFAIFFFFLSVGREGPVTEALLNLLLKNMKHGPPTVRVPVPY